MYGTLNDDGKLDLSYLRALVTYHSFLGPLSQAEVIVDEVAKTCHEYLTTEKRNEFVYKVSELLVQKFEFNKIINDTIDMICQPAKEGETDMTHEEVKAQAIATDYANPDTDRSRLHELIATEIFSALPFNTPLSIDDVIWNFRQALNRYGGDMSKYDLILNEAIYASGGPANWIKEPVAPPPGNGGSQNGGIVAEEKDNTLLYVGIGVGLVLIYLMFK